MFLWQEQSAPQAASPGRLGILRRGATVSVDASQTRYFAWTPVGAKLLLKRSRVQNFCSSAAGISAMATPQLLSLVLQERDKVLGCVGPDPMAKVHTVATDCSGLDTPVYAMRRLGLRLKQLFRGEMRVWMLCHCILS